MRPAIEVAHDVCEEMEEYGPYFAVKAIEADRAELVAEIVAWVRARSIAGHLLADHIEAKFGGRDAK